jgi:transcriptional repressor NrdR
MRCPFCAHEDSQVKDSRPSEDGAAIRRRRQCEACGARFTTFERVQLRDLTVVKKDAKREPFDRDKLARAIGHATRKREIDPAKSVASNDKWKRWGTRFPRCASAKRSWPA